MKHNTPKYHQSKDSKHAPSPLCEDLTILVIRAATQLVVEPGGFTFVEEFLDALANRVEAITDGCDHTVLCDVEYPSKAHVYARFHKLPVLVVDVSAGLSISYDLKTLLGEDYVDYFRGVTLPFDPDDYRSMYMVPNKKHDACDVNVVSLVQACHTMDSFLHTCPDKDLVAYYVERALRTTTEKRIMAVANPDGEVRKSDDDLVDAIVLMTLISGDTVVAEHGYTHNPRDTISLLAGRFMDHGARAIREITKVYGETIEGKRYTLLNLSTKRRIMEKLSTKTTTRIHFSEVLMPDKLRKEGKGLTAEEAAEMDTYYRSVGGPVTELYTKIADAVHEDLKELYDEEAPETEDENSTTNSSAPVEDTTAQ